MRIAAKQPHARAWRAPRRGGALARRAPCARVVVRPALERPGGAAQARCRVGRHERALDQQRARAAHGVDQHCACTCGRIWPSAAPNWARLVLGEA